MIAVLPPSLPRGRSRAGRRRDPECARVPRCGQCGVRGGAPGTPLPVPTRVGGLSGGRRAQLSGKWPLRPVAPPTAAVRSPRDRTREAAAAGPGPRTR